jgi:hypothetical protein
MFAKIGKKIQADWQLSEDLAKNRQSKFGFMPANEGERLFARRLMSQACKQGRAQGQVTLSYDDALYVLNVLNRADGKAGDTFQPDR